MERGGDDGFSKMPDGRDGLLGSQALHVRLFFLMCFSSVTLFFLCLVFSLFPHFPLCVWNFDAIFGWNRAWKDFKNLAAAARAVCDRMESLHEQLVPIDQSMRDELSSAYGAFHRRKAKQVLKREWSEVGSAGAPTKQPRV